MKRPFKPLKPNFWRKLDTLLKHHLPLMDSLEILRKESADPSERAAMEEIIKRLKAGEPLSRAVMCDAVTRGVLLAGERAGDLTAAVERIAVRMDTQGRLRAQMVGATVYPALILALCVGLCVILSAVVLPRFQKLFVTMGVGDNLPWLTQTVIGFGQWCRDWGLWAILIATAAVWAVRVYVKAERWGRVMWGLPVVGALWRAADRENFFNTLAVMLKSNAPLDEALSVTSAAVAHTPLGDVAAMAVGRVQQGDMLSASLRGSGSFEEGQLQLIALGEHSGSVGESAEHLAGLLRERLAVELKAAVALLEPALILFMAGFVALMVTALFMPLGPLVAKLAEGG